MREHALRQLAAQCFGPDGSAVVRHYLDACQPPSFGDSGMQLAEAVVVFFVAPDHVSDATASLQLLQLRAHFAECHELHGVLAALDLVHRTVLSAAESALCGVEFPWHAATSQDATPRRPLSVRDIPPLARYRGLVDARFAGPLAQAFGVERLQVLWQAQAMPLATALASHHVPEELWSVENVVKILTSFCLLAPLAARHSRLNDAAWLLMALGSLVHHCLPHSARAHLIDHLAALVGSGLVLSAKEGPAAAVCLAYWPAAALASPRFHARVGLAACVVVWLVLFYARLAAYVAALATAALFAAQRARLPHAHSAWHVAMGVLGWLVMQPTAVRHGVLWAVREGESLWI